MVPAWRNRRHRRADIAAPTIAACVTVPVGAPGAAIVPIAATDAGGHANLATCAVAVVL